MPKSAILAFKSIFAEFIKKDIEYFVSPNNSEIYSATTMALSFEFTDITTLPFLSSDRMTFTLHFNYVVYLVIGYSISSPDTSSLTGIK
jgi:hypothetical protein